MMTSPAPLVFIVDDDASVRKALGRLVRAAGYEVELFGCASEFLAREVSIRPACLLLDVRMPGMSGIELQQTLEGTQRAHDHVEDHRPAERPDMDRPRRRLRVVDDLRAVDAGG